MSLPQRNDPVHERGVPVKARIWKEDGQWEWDVLDDRPPATRSTGARLTWREAVDSALEELAWMVSVKDEMEAQL